MSKPILIGISSCLLGEQVRFDGGHKRDNYICDLLGHYFDFLPLCPEVAIGLGIPRPAIHLRGKPDNPRLVEVKNPTKDHTAAMLNFSQQYMGQLTEISGYLLKSKSPTCGWKRVKIYQDGKQGSLAGQGLFARILEENFPNLPIEEEGRLNDSRLRENFIERVFIYKEWQQLVKTSLTASKLIAFHSRHKLTLMAHSIKTYKALGQLLSQLKQKDLDLLGRRYFSEFMLGMTYLTTPKKHANVLQHCLGYFKKFLLPLDKQELLEAIDNYRRGLLPLIVPLTLIKHHLNHYPQPYLNEQSYLSPYPEELMLRNHI